MSDAFEDRVLCDDGMCTGVVARDGRCGTCGRLHDVAPNDDAPDATSDDVTSDDATNDDATNDDATSDEAAPPEATNDETDDARELCDDGLCTGVLNADRVCGTCGRPAGS